jgi:predicted ATP-grasp superfamily ATP-dependent carboligase
MSAFVTDGDQRPALAIARSLGRRGVPVVVGAERHTSLASASKYCAEHVTYPSPYRDPEAFDRFLLNLVERRRIDVVMPVTDVTTHLVSKNAPALSRHTAVAAPPFAAFDFAGNKMRLLQQAVECGIPVPRSHLVAGLSDVERLLGQIRYPAVIKPMRSRIRTATGWLVTEVQYAHSQADLLRRYRDTGYLDGYPSMIQERIVGPGKGVFVLCDRGRLRAAFAHRRLREKPPSGGVSVLSESTELDPELVAYAMRILQPLEWHGVAMMEFKQDRCTGRPFLMEINGRFWGSLDLAVQAGVDFPYLNYQLALGQPLEPQRRYEVGRRSRWLLGDLDHLLIRLFHRGEDQHPPEGSSSRLGAVKQFVGHSGGRTHYDVISTDDPGPFLHELWLNAREWTGSLARLGYRLRARAPRYHDATATTRVTAVK